MKPGDFVGGRFELLAVAGTGGMGVVFRAADRDSGATVALKVLGGNTEDRRRFAREIEHLAAISHPRVVRFLTHGATPSGEPYLVMEWLEGESLQRRLETRGLSVAEAVAVIGQAAEALAEVHGRGLVHRDLKPSNLMFEQGDLSRLKLIDFGIARGVGDGKGATLTGTLVGTPGYMSPEQARGVREVDARADVFSLGCVLYECVTGWTPFAGKHSMALRTKILFAEPLPIGQLCAEVPADLAALIGRMLAKSPDDRPRDGGEVARALAALAPIAPGPRRRTVDDEPRTVALREAPLQDFVVLTGFPVIDGAPSAAALPATALPAITAAVAAIDPAIRVAPLDHAAIIIRVPGAAAPADQRAQAALAVRCAQACRAALPKLPIALAAVATSAVIERGARDAIDRAVDQLFKAMVRGKPVAWVDEVIRGLIGDVHL
jgi:hypothetical protein